MVTILMLTLFYPFAIRNILFAWMQWSCIWINTQKRKRTNAVIWREKKLKQENFIQSHKLTDTQTKHHEHNREREREKHETRAKVMENDKKIYIFFLEHTKKKKKTKTATITHKIFVQADWCGNAIFRFSRSIRFSISHSTYRNLAVTILCEILILRRNTLKNDL